MFNASFHSKVTQHDTSSCLYSCSIVCRSLWNLHPSLHSVTLPPSISTQQKKVEKFFRKGYPNRSLKILQSEGKVTLRILLKGEARTIEVSVVDYFVLMILSKNRILKMSLSNIGVYTLNDIVSESDIPVSLLLKSIHSLCNNKVVICVQRSPPSYRHIVKWGEQGLDISEEEFRSNEILIELRRFERYVIEILNSCTTFNVTQLYKRLRLFLQGVNRCR